MATYTAPGVYVEEVPSAIKPIAGVGTGTSGFIGISNAITGVRNPTTKTGMPEKPAGEAYPQAEAQVPQPINNWTEFTQKFGDIQTANQYLAHKSGVFGSNTTHWVPSSMDSRRKLNRRRTLI